MENRAFMVADCTESEGLKVAEDQGKSPANRDGLVLRENRQ
jgi:hypothetical protein